MSNPATDGYGPDGIDGSAVGRQLGARVAAQHLVQQVAGLARVEQVGGDGRGFLLAVGVVCLPQGGHAPGDLLRGVRQGQGDPSYVFGIRHARHGSAHH